MAIFFTVIFLVSRMDS